MFKLKGKKEYRTKYIIYQNIENLGIHVFDIYYFITIHYYNMHNIKNYHGHNLKNTMRKCLLHEILKLIIILIFLEM